MTDEEVLPQLTGPGPTHRPGASARTVVALVVIAVFAGVLVAKFCNPAQRSNVGGGAEVASMTSVRNDASADYEVAAKTGRPIYLLFHSLS